MAAEARGSRVLDVGCSEGILGVLLARRGIEVTGVDINADALGFARELLAREPEDVRGRVDLVHGDFLRTRGLSGLYDTVVMGEMLQCVDDPRAMLDRGLECLRPGGRVVATTPFGMPPDEDDRRTFSLTDMIELLRPRLGLEHLSVEGNHIRFVGSLSEDSEGSWQRLDAEAVLSMTDAALVALETELYRMLAMRESRIERLQGSLQERVEVDRDARHIADTSRGEIKKLEFQVKLDQMALEQLKSQVDAKTKDLRATSREAGDDASTPGDDASTPGDIVEHIVPRGRGYGERGEASAEALEAATRPAPDIPLEARVAGGACCVAGTSRTGFQRFRSDSAQWGTSLR